MFVIEVVPLGRGVLPETLSYFSPVTYSLGALLKIPIQKRTIPAVVTSITDAFSMKTALRAATFSLRKLPEQTPYGTIPKSIVSAAQKTADYHASPLHATLTSLLPKEVREGAVDLFSTEVLHTLSHEDPLPRVFIAPTVERHSEYGRMIRECFARNTSILFIAPTLEYLLELHDACVTGIDSYTVLLSSEQSSAVREKAYTKLREEKHPLCILATPTYACVPRHDIDTIVLEHERSNGYHAHNRPHLDYRIALNYYAKERGARIIFADMIVRTETWELIETGRALPLFEDKTRLHLPGVLKIIDQRLEEEKDHPFSLFSKEVLYNLDVAIQEKKRVFLFAARRGISPLIGCIDCGAIIRDPESGAPLSLIRTHENGEELRWFISTVSGFKTRAYDLCPHCGSWRLRERGIGIQHVADQIKKLYPDTHAILFDNQTASTHKKAHALRTKFYTTPGTFLIGTARALPYLAKPVDMSVVVSHDSLRAIPSWRQQEESFAILMTLREQTKGAVYIQTRTDDDALEWARSGILTSLYEDELSARTSFHYPPYMVFIHFAWKEAGTKIRDLLRARFEEDSISVYSAPYPDVETPLHYGLIRIPRESWPKPSIVEKIRHIPSSIRVTINPDRII